MVTSTSAPRPPRLETVTLKPRELHLFQSFIEDQVGIHLGESKKALLVGRLGGRLRKLGMESFSEYFDLVNRDEVERIHMIDAICTNETRFFREPHQFRFLEQQIIPEWISQARSGQRPRSVRVWSAGCSSGEEPYSIAMALASQLPLTDGWHIHVLATDVSSRILARAESATWAMTRAREIPDALLKTFMLRGYDDKEGLMRAKPSLRQLIAFKRLNLVRDPFPTEPFDLVFCRNVMIYFSPETRLEILRKLFARTNANGYLFLGHAESLAGTPLSARSAAPNIYSPK